MKNPPPGRADMTALEEENRRLSAQLVHAESAHAELIVIHLAYRRLSEAAAGPAALAVLIDLVATVLGCERFEVFRCADGHLTERLDGIGSWADEEWQRLDSAPLVREALDAGRVRTQEPWVGATSDREPVACVPLSGGGAVTGMLVLYTLLPQKYEWTSSDAALFDVLSTLGGKVLPS